MVNQSDREHERIEIEMATRIWIDEAYRGKDIKFEGFARTANIATGGVFVCSTYLLPVGFPINLDMEVDDTTTLAVRGEVVNTSDDGGPYGSGMGIEFTRIDAENRERLLRFFISDTVRDFYEQRFAVEFPHLKDVLSLKDIALVINLWEDKENRLQALAVGDYRPVPAKAAGRKTAARKSR